MSRSPRSGIAFTVALLLVVPAIAFWALTSLGVLPRADVPLAEIPAPPPQFAGETTEVRSELSRPRPVAPYDSAAPDEVAPNAIPPVPTPALIGSQDAGRAGQAAAVASRGSTAAVALIVPVAGVRRDQLVDTYSQARSGGRSHDAIDIIAPRGTPVVAAAAGSVLKLFQSVQGGTTLYQLDPDRRTIYYYAHLDRYAPDIVEGMQLQQGQTLGYVGNTGNSGAGNYHLHFEITTTLDPKQYWGGVASNPYPRLR
jgi:peptidoglycan LD-endopeptidase LytH